MRQKKTKREQLMKKFNAISKRVYPHTDSYFDLDKPIALCADEYLNKRIAFIEAVDLDTFVFWAKQGKQSICLPLSILNVSVLEQVIREMEEDANRFLDDEDD